MTKGKECIWRKNCKYCGTSGRCYAKDLLGLRFKSAVKQIARYQGKCEYGKNK